MADDTDWDAVAEMRAEEDAQRWADEHRPEVPAVTGVTRWRNKAVVVDALRYTGDNAGAVAKFCRFPAETGNLRITSIQMPGTDGHRRAVRTGDWLVRSPEDGEVYVHSARQFEAGYEPAGEPATPVAQAIVDAGRVEAAAAVLERRYPHARPDVLDTVISELHSVARAWRRMAGGVLAAAETTPIGPECFADSTGSVISWKGENFYRPGARPGDSPTWEELGLSLTRERDALFAEVCELRDAASTTRLAVNDPEPLVLPPDEFAAFKAVAARFGYPPPVAADLTPAQCEALRRAVDLLGARIHSAEDARIIADARDALRVLEGAETPAGGPAPGDTGRVLPTLHGQAREHARGKDGSEDGEREAFVRQYRVLAGQEDPEVVLIGWCAEAIGCLFQRTFDGTGLGVTLGELTDAAAEHEGEQGERAHAYLAEINGEGDEP